ncbi:protein AMEIOTIC 1 isoform X2 [Corylus avellana]|uniref:protein AMEIOTIC 1 isoform X2 n=1 Tax=Corylus avellana TaxID=13451 RepID=UPI00286B2CB7|nr:protein AMEIOTIC 1 isoform X2 [Corylus avellana]
MAQLAGHKRVAACVSVHRENKPQLSSSIAEEADSEDDRKPVIKAEPLVMSGIRKRKRLGRSELIEMKAATRMKERQNNSYNSSQSKCDPHSQLIEMKAATRMKERQNSSYTSSQSKRDSKKLKGMERWSADRYKMAEQSMLEVMKAEGATFGNPISRPALRTAARKRIGDTGLLDHLLKHIDGKVLPGGTERFRRCFSPTGVMEYWLESADLVNARREAGWQDPYWVAPNRPGCGPSQDPVSAGELMLLKTEIVKLKRDMQELVSKNQERDEAEVMHKDLVKYKSTVDERLKEITNSLGIHEELIAWKAQVEQQLGEIKNSLSSIQASRQDTAFSPPASERWEDWLENSNQDNIHGNEFAPFYESTDMANVKKEVAVQNPYSVLPTIPGNSSSEDHICARDLELKEEMAKMKRDVAELVPVKQEEDHANVTPDSSATANSKSDLDNSLLPVQEVIMELLKWKDKTEQRLEQISNSVNCLQAPNQIDFLLPFSC